MTFEEYYNTIITHPSLQFAWWYDIDQYKELYKKIYYHRNIPIEEAVEYILDVILLEEQFI